MAFNQRFLSCVYLRTDRYGGTNAIQWLVTLNRFGCPVSLEILRLVLVIVCAGHKGCANCAKAFNEAWYS
jgi:hypothetical protein